MDNTAIAIKEDHQLIEQSNELVKMAHSLVIKNDLSCKTATDFAVTLKAFIDGPGTYHDDEIALVNQLRDRLHEKRRAIVDGPKAAYKIVKDRIAVFVDEQRRKREEAQRKAEEEAREKERKKQAEIQEKIDAENARLRKIREEEQRKRDEADAEIERQRSKAKREQLEKEEAERRRVEKERISREKEKSEEKKDLLVEKREAVYVAPKAVHSVSPSNMSVSFDWDARVTNKASVPEQYKIVDIAALERAQKAQKGALKVPGVVFTKRAIGSLRTK